jgi:phosphoglycolate phosphatase-like HAD superfamily hydrolase
MPLRIGFDMDGVLADFASAYHAVEDRLFGAASPHQRPGDPEKAAVDDNGEPLDRAAGEERRAMTRRERDQVWRAIHDTPDFWMSLAETETGIVKRLQETSLRLRWEVFFITKRPATLGDTVQRQTQRWLAAHGFDLPSVLVVPGSRGAAAAALTLDYHVDDSAQNAVDVQADSSARILLVVDPADDTGVRSAHRLGIGTVATIGAALDALEQATLGRTEPGLLARVARLVGWSPRS